MARDPPFHRAQAQAGQEGFGPAWLPTTGRATGIWAAKWPRVVASRPPWPAQARPPLVARSRRREGRLLLKGGGVAAGVDVRLQFQFQFQLRRASVQSVLGEDTKRDTISFSESPFHLRSYCILLCYEIRSLSWCEQPVSVSDPLQLQKFLISGRTTRSEATRLTSWFQFLISDRQLGSEIASLASFQISLT